MSQSPEIVSAEQLASQQQAAVSGAATEAERRAAESFANAMDTAKSADLARQLYAYENTRNRTAWILTTARREYNKNNNGYPYSNDVEGNEKSETNAVNNWTDKNASLVFNVNPTSYQMDNPFRQQVVDTKGGPIIHTFRDPARGYTNFGFATMNIEMSSGSMMPRAQLIGAKALSGSQHWNMPPAVGNFYRWLEIVQEDTVYEDNEGNILPNYQIIKMSTLLFPRLTMYGYFITNANWSEQAENPAEIQNWQTAFKIYKTSPSLTIDQISQLYSKWEEEYNKQHTY